MGLNRLKRGYLIQFKRYVDQLTGSSGRDFRESPGLFADLNKRLDVSTVFGAHVLSHRCAPCERNGKDSARCPTQFLAAIGLIK